MKKLQHWMRQWLPFIAIMCLSMMYNVVETNYFSRTTNQAEQQMYPRTDTEVIADGICILIAAIAFSTLGIIQALLYVVDWFSNVKVTVTHVKDGQEQEPVISKAAKDYQSTI